MSVMLVGNGYLMPIINQTAIIDANIEAVFDLISQLEEFPRYADVLRRVQQIEPGLYRWTAQACGITLHWDSVITDCVRPTHIAWRSVRGFANSGAYSLASIPGGTRVSITIEYSLPDQAIAKLLAPFIAPLIDKSASEVLRRVKRQLEGAADDSKRAWRRARPRKRIRALLATVRKNARP
jgi:uncharacterized membrane protein